VNRCKFPAITSPTRRREAAKLKMNAFACFAPWREEKSSTTELVKFLIIAVALFVFAACRPIVAAEETTMTNAPGAAPPDVTDFQAAQRQDRSALFLPFLLD
jgi:hypothetical protein